MYPCSMMCTVVEGCRMINTYIIRVPAALRAETPFTLTRHSLTSREDLMQQDAAPHDRYHPPSAMHPRPRRPCWDGSGWLRRDLCWGGSRPWKDPRCHQCTYFLLDPPEGGW